MKLTLIMLLLAALGNKCPFPQSPQSDAYYALAVLRYIRFVPKRVLKKLSDKDLHALATLAVRYVVPGIMRSVFKELSDRGMISRKSPMDLTKTFRAMYSCVEDQFNHTNYPPVASDVMFVLKEVEKLRKKGVVAFVGTTSVQILHEMIDRRHYYKDVRAFWNSVKPLLSLQLVLFEQRKKALANVTCSLYNVIGRDCAGITLAHYVDYV